MQDTSTGQLVVEHRTKLGQCHVLRYRRRIGRSHRRAAMRLGEKASCVPVASAVSKIYFRSVAAVACRMGQIEGAAALRSRLLEW